MTAPQPGQRAPATPRERHLRDVLNSALVRLRRVEQGGASMAEVRAEVKRTADMIAARIDATEDGE